MRERLATMVKIQVTEAGAPLEAVDPLTHGQPAVLHDFLGLRMAADDGSGEADQRRAWNRRTNAR